MENARDSIVFVADLPDYAKIEARDPDRAAELASRFHQVLGECIYAYGGSVHDTMGSIVIAELSDPGESLHCVESLQKRIRTEFGSEPALSPRAVLTSGEVHDKDFSIAGHAVQNALSILDALKKGQMLVSSPVLGLAGVETGEEPLLNLGEIGYYLFPISRPSQASPQPQNSSTKPQTGGAPPVSTGDGAAPPASTKGKTGVVVGVAVAIALVLAAAGYFLTRPERPETVVETVETPAEPEDVRPATVSLAIGDVRFAPEVDGEISSAAVATALMNALLRSVDDVEIDPSSPNSVGADVRLFVAEGAPSESPGNPAAAQVTPVPGATEAARGEAHVIPWIERSGERLEGPAVLYEDEWSIITPTIRWAGEQLGFDTSMLIPESPRVREAFANVVQGSTALTGESDLTALHAALFDEPEFFPGWLVLARVETASEKLAPLILDGLRNVSRIMPGREDLARQLGRRELQEGTLAGAVEAFGRVRESNPDDEEARRVLALGALAAHEPELFSEFAGTRDRRLHPADVEVSEGKINEAVKKYYETEAEVPDNPYLMFKIGRIAVLRRSPQIATIEMDKLEAQGVEPQRSFLRAYIAADDGDRAAAEAALNEALANAEWADSPMFHAAEIHAILRDAPRTLAAIEQSVARQEPMMHAIATDPLFGYLINEPRFRDSVSRLLQHQREIGASLAAQS